MAKLETTNTVVYLGLVNGDENLSFDVVLKDACIVLGPRALVIVLVYEGYDNSPRTEGFSYSPCIRGIY